MARSMQFLRTLFWVLLAGIAVAFAFNNWTTVPIRLWGGLIADVNLPLLLAVALLLGFVPTRLAMQASRWRWKQRVNALERTVADLTRSAATPPAPPGRTMEEGPPPPIAIPTAVPPGVA